jgi:hypothetical protein
VSTARAHERILPSETYEGASQLVMVEVMVEVKSAAACPQLDHSKPAANSSRNRKVQHYCKVSPGGLDRYHAAVQAFTTRVKLYGASCAG